MHSQPIRIIEERANGGNIRCMRKHPEFVDSVNAAKHERRAGSIANRKKINRRKYVYDFVVIGGILM